MKKEYLTFFKKIKEKYPSINFGINKKDNIIYICFCKSFFDKNNNNIEKDIYKIFHPYKEDYEDVKIIKTNKKEVKNCYLNTFKSYDNMNLLLLSKDEVKNINSFKRLKKKYLEKQQVKLNYKLTRKEYEKSFLFKRIFRFTKNIISFLLVIGILLSSVSLYLIYPKLRLAKEKSTNLELSINQGTFTKLNDTEIYDINNELLSTIKKTNYKNVSLEDMPQYIVDGYIAVEDRNFKTHFGVDPKAILRAGKVLIESKLFGDGGIKQGGSTITMQVVKNNLIQDQSKNFERKMIELFLAPSIEKRYSKAQIMNFYINTNHYGNNVDGLGTAAYYYLNKDVKDLTLGECAMFVGISNRPSAYNPKDNIENAYKKRNFVLKIMLDEGYISKEEYDNAIKEKINLDIQYISSVPEEYYTSYAIHDSTLKIMQNKGFNFKYNFESQEEEDKYKIEYNKVYSDISNDIRNGGYKLYTNINKDKQNILQNNIDNGLKQYTEIDDDKFAMQASAVYINNNTGFVEAIVGGRGENDYYNRAFLSFRQPGSTIKPFLVYGPAYESGSYYPSTIVIDEQIEDGPKNATNKYLGKTTLRESFKQSINTISYKLLSEIGIKNSINYLEKMQFSNITYLDNFNNSIALGGMTYGTNVLEMTKAMNTIFNKGVYTNKGTVNKIEHQFDGNIFNEKQFIENKLYSKETAYLILENMKEVKNKGGTAANLRLYNENVFIKTGTTSNQKDTWLVGGDVDKSISVWVGYDKPKSTNKYGSTLAGPIWKNIMIDFGISDKDIEKPDTIVEHFIDKNGNPTIKNTGKKDIFPKK